MLGQMFENRQLLICARGGHLHSEHRLHLKMSSR